VAGGLQARTAAVAELALQLTDVILQLSYGAIYGSSTERAAALDGWRWTYNHRTTRRPPPQPPIARLNELDNLTGSCSSTHAFGCRP
jgi:hypothetical protein